MLKNVALALPKFPQNTTSMALVFSGESNSPKTWITDIWGVHSCSSQGIPGVKLELGFLFPQPDVFSILDLIVLYCPLGQKHLTGNRVFLVLPKETVDLWFYCVGWGKNRLFLSGVNLSMRVSGGTVSLGQDYRSCPYGCPCGHRSNRQESFVERRLDSLPGRSSHALCCKRAFQVDEGDTLFLSKCWTWFK